MKRLFVLFLWSAALMADKNFLPDNTFTISRNDLALAYRRLSPPQGGTCDTQLIHYAEGYSNLSFPRLHAPAAHEIAEITKRAHIISNLKFSSTASSLLHSMQHPQGSFGDIPALLDALEEEGNEIRPSLSLFRQGLVDHFKTSQTRARHSEIADEYELLFYLLRFNQIPAFVLSYYSIQAIEPGRDFFRREVYFEEGRFIGLSLDAQTLLQFEKELLDSPTLTHLRVQVTTANLVQVLGSPVLKKIKSLSLEIIGEDGPEYSIRDEIHDEELRQRLQKNTRHLKALEIEVHLAETLPPMELVLFFQLIQPERLERLSLSGLTFNYDFKEWSIWLRHLTWVSFSRCSFPLQDAEGWTQIFQSLNPNLRTLRLSLPAVQNLRGLTHFKPIELTELKLRVYEPEGLQNNGSLWKNLTKLELSIWESHSSLFNRDLVNATHAILSQCEKLEDLKIDFHPFGLFQPRTASPVLMAILNSLPNRTLTTLRISGPLFEEFVQALRQSQAHAQLKVLEAGEIILGTALLRELHALSLEEVRSLAPIEWWNVTMTSLPVTSFSLWFEGVVIPPGPFSLKLRDLNYRALQQREQRRIYEQHPLAR